MEFRGMRYIPHYANFVALTFKPNEDEGVTYTSTIGNQSAAIMDCIRQLANAQNKKIEHLLFNMMQCPEFFHINVSYEIRGRLNFE